MGRISKKTRSNQKRRAKSSRKKHDTADEALLQNHLAQDRSLIAAPLDNLFFEDVPNGPKPTRAQFFQKKKLTSEIIFEEGKKHLASVTRSNSVAPKPNVAQLKKINQLMDLPTLPSYNSITKKQPKRSTQLVQREKEIPKATYNLWDQHPNEEIVKPEVHKANSKRQREEAEEEEEEEVEENPWISKFVRPQIHARKQMRKNFQEKFNIPTEGISYNPTYESHQSHLKKAHQQAVAHEKVKQYVNNINWDQERKKRYWNQMRALRAKRRLEENKEKKEQLPIKPFSKTKTPFKNKAQRIAEKKKKHREAKESNLQKRKKQREALENASHLAKEMDERLAKKEERQAARKKKRAQQPTKEERLHSKFLKNRIEPYLLSDEIPKSLRTLPSVSKPMNDLIANLQRRKIIELPGNPRSKRQVKPDRHVFVGL